MLDWHAVTYSTRPSPSNTSVGRRLIVGFRYGSDKRPALLLQEHRGPFGQSRTSSSSAPFEKIQSPKCISQASAARHQASIIHMRMVIASMLMAAGTTCTGAVKQYCTEVLYSTNKSLYTTKQFKKRHFFNCIILYCSTGLPELIVLYFRCSTAPQELIVLYFCVVWPIPLALSSRKFYSERFLNGKFKLAPLPQNRELKLLRSFG